MPAEFTLDRKIISGNRVTIPKDLLDEWNLNAGDVIRVTFKKQLKVIKGFVV